MFITKYKKIFLFLSTILIIVSVIFIFTFGLKPGIDFKGGALLEVSYAGGRPEISLLEDAIKTLNINQAIIQPTAENDYLIKTRDLSEPEHQMLSKSLSLEGKYPVLEKSFTSIGPSVGSELKRKAIISIIMVILAIILFITYAFRKVSRPVSSWKYGVITIVTLLHDIIIPTGIFALLSHYTGAEVDTLFVLALLTILGLSVHDKIVVFDRIRENLKDGERKDFAQTVGISTSQTIVRSINITLTIIFVLVPLYLFGPETTKNFALILTIGLFFGIYSSLFFASPLLILAEEWQRKK
ncbi:MAG: Protein translocase subunit SecF [Parcubacteria group bacterium GW2011_GWC1_36_9]|uniref:Protein-export membrane protein SecF n=1 Tax=Candidatus Yanofskybacteria bacterium GW2011_GWC2_37_9 TaxID=1619028 RepID=A0A0G0I6G4_9BACT|nr:MAG: Protein translocase subunit SecF [Parcubacteria group bacterium GW2011_GWC1_36_9]KKQ28277.1 MAG: Protein translocase subunit SecF [Parcubacteria group bacterium GW2011_GWB1_37_13]KKQ46580.1 MAG: Protein translocase subunit SecF [Candidatus Yanofskybacteria bacterium GW2011_GWC2_37_9]